MQLLDTLSNIIILTGPYGSGKTNLAVNLALWQQRAGKQTVLVDLDIVNPYFRSADFATLLEEAGATLMASEYANSNLDLPAVGAGLSEGLLSGGATVIADVGGEAAGAVALGQYAPQLLRHGASMVFVYNHYRYLGDGMDEAVEILLAIQAVSRLPFFGVLNNSHLGQFTTPETVLNSLESVNTFCSRVQLPLLGNTIPLDTCEDYSAVPQPLPVALFVKKPWENSHTKRQ